jgi:hypothetical protein
MNGRPGPGWEFWVGVLNGVLITAAIAALIWLAW